MTMIAGCHFGDAAVIVADSRVTQQGIAQDIHSDTAQKIISLGQKIAIAFAGNVEIANDIVKNLCQHIVKEQNCQLPRVLANELPRIARHCYQQYKDKKSSLYLVSLILGGVDSSGVYLWTFESPHFNARKLSYSFAVMGSGSVVKPYLVSNYDRIKNYPDLKTKTDHLLVGLSSELSRHGVETVGGLFQTILLDTIGIRPVSHGFMDLSPEAPGQAKEIKFTAGRWIQSDFIKNEKLELIHPAKIARQRIKENHFHDFNLSSEGKKEASWYLTYFFTCIKVNRATDYIEFQGVCSQFAAHKFPRSVSLLFSLGFWGGVGDYNLEYRINTSGGIKTIFQRTIRNEFLPEIAEFDDFVTFEVESSGIVFLDCYLNDKFLCRRALYFAKLAATQAPASQEDSVNFGQRLVEQLTKEQDAYSDPMMQKKKCIPYHFVVCHQSECRNMVYKFVEEYAAVYWKKYPLVSKVFIATGIRLSKGKHEIRIDLVNALTRESETLTKDIVESESDCREMKFEGELIIRIPASGVYFFNLFADNEFVTSALLAAETEEARYFWSLPEAEKERVRNGEHIALLKRSKQAS